jgi:hypothetical protein
MECIWRRRAFAITNYSASIGRLAIAADHIAIGVPSNVSWPVA